MTEIKSTSQKAQRKESDGCFGYDIDLKEAESLTHDQVVKDWLKKIYAAGYYISKITGEF